MPVTLETSYLPGRRSSARSIGLAKASPTITICSTRFLSTDAHSSSASKCADSSVTTVPPAISADRAVNRPVPCISGQAGMLIGPRPASLTISMWSARSSGIRTTRAGFNRARRSESWRHMTPFGMPVVPPV